MNPFEMVAIIVIAAMIVSVVRAKYANRGEEPDPRENAEKQRLREEVKELKERLHVLERIATERENSLAREIEELRDR